MVNNLLIYMGLVYYMNQKTMMVLIGLVLYKKVNLRGLSDYRLSTITIGVSRALSYKRVNISYGLGSIFYNQKFYKFYENISEKIESQINFMHFIASTKIKSFQFETKILGNYKTIIFSCSIKKGII